MSTNVFPSKNSTETKLQEQISGSVSTADADLAVTSAIETVSEKIAPVWPLKDYVAVNPYMGFANTEFLETRDYLRGVSDLELFMPVDYYRQQFQAGKIQRDDISAAVDELVADGVTGAEQIDVNQVVRFLKQAAQAGPTADAEFTKPANPTRTLLTVCESIDQEKSLSLGDLVLEEISKHCAAHYDDGQSGWASPARNVSLFAAWQLQAQHDLTLEIRGISGFRKFAQQLPEQPEAAIEWLLKELGVPSELCQDYLLAVALTMPGWSAWTKYQHRQSEIAETNCDDLAGLLAIRLAHEVALMQHLDFQVDWVSIAQNYQSEGTLAIGHHMDDLSRYALLRASEIAFRNQLVSQIDVSQTKNPTTHRNRFSMKKASVNRKLAQIVFCIDVRSERIRRHLEASSSEVETFGFAGFFGLPIEFVELGATSGKANVPALISPSFQVSEKIDSACGHTNDDATDLASQQRGTLRFLRSAWKSFQSSAVSMFAFVETTGLLYGWKLLQRSFGSSGQIKKRFDGVCSSETAKLSPSLIGLEEQGIGLTQQVDMAESILRGIGIVENFARLVVFCGHGSQVENNPLQAGLDCGACGGHSGEPNARLAAKLMNQTEVRQELAARGIAIPDDTQFVAGLHNTTTDSIDFFDQHLLPISHEGDLAELESKSACATRMTRIERLPLLSGANVSDLDRRSLDWSEVRPEWGLAGNAAFIVGPREMTQSVSLDGRSFLHSYDYTKDPEFAVLEQIMTAPMVVANWINMQYYASTVDPIHFGSGNKTVHNVVGQFGVFSGNGGDLMTGLPWQSVHDGTNYQHHPLRLLVVLAAPRTAIDSILQKHANVADLVTKGWLQMLAHEDGEFYRYTEQRTWEPVE